MALQAFRIGNRGRLSLCEALRVLYETRAYLALGFPSLAAYAGAFFQLRRAEAYEHVRVARALIELAELREAFGAGRLSWSVLKAVTRVATVDTQAAWLEFAARHPVERTLAEAGDALRRGRSAPRGSSFGMPNLDQRLVLRFSRADMEKIRTWIASVAAALTERTGQEEVTVERVILFLCESGGADAAGASSGQQISAGRACRDRVVYQRCPDCGRSRVATRDGFVEVPATEVEPHEGCAETVVIDGPTPPALRRRILAREGERCGNPRCGHRADHCHHIVFRSRGGRTEAGNEIAVCATCHALVHAGLLRVTGRANGELCWQPAASGDGLGAALGADRAAAERLPVLHLEAPLSWADARAANGEESADADSTTGAVVDRDALASALVRLGVPVDRSKRLVGAAIEALSPGTRTDTAVLRHALASL
jgi:5-methylcytosine-specific restriction endonuclease McrA